MKRFFFQAMKHNGSLYAHVFFARSGYPPDPNDPEYDKLAAFGRTHRKIVFLQILIFVHTLIEKQSDSIWWDFSCPWFQLLWYTYLSPNQIKERACLEIPKTLMRMSKHLRFVLDKTTCVIYFRKSVCMWHLDGFWCLFELIRHFICFLVFFSSYF